MEKMEKIIIVLEIPVTGASMFLAKLLREGERMLSRSGNGCYIRVFLSEQAFREKYPEAPEFGAKTRVVWEVVR